MPSGRTHDRITYLSLPPLAVIIYILTGRGGWLLWFSGAYLFSGLMFGPDLDIYSVQYKRWGVIRWIWLPYQSFLKHRSFFSHGVILGTVIRVIYLSTLVLILAIFFVAIAQLIWGFNWNWRNFAENIFNLLKNVYLGEAVVIFIGLELGAMSHSLSDYLVSHWKRSQKKPKKRRYKGKKSRGK
ncbi:metal-binding protein [Crocosphaera sp.]|uniref:metal-binding protein n=1 Tax=Crocosphaera sp. TaxID=2729996 RepID=UPI002606299E|nr:metal-binding protein [Crocosphaera sp.]MDJ0581434.1 metal-binding protein [Crocosphaera sp.]